MTFNFTFPLSTCHTIPLFVQEVLGDQRGRGAGYCVRAAPRLWGGASGVRDRGGSAGFYSHVHFHS